MDTITTTLRREPFAQIIDRTKRIEYREIKRYVIKVEHWDRKKKRPK
jgi:hypothetical protein